MKKDIIYIDVEDDITAIIGKVKESAEKIVALVPPKRIGVLQSAVNLRLLQRTASQNEKRIVLITGNQALTGLAAAASIPVARNLQSKPEIAEIPALDIDDGDDVIDGSDLPVGIHAGFNDDKSADEKREEDLIKGVDVEREPSKAPPVIGGGSGKKKPSGKSRKVPNFNVFRKRLVLCIVAAVVLIGGLIWAIVFAPGATIVLTARTSDAEVNDVAKLGKQTNAEQGIIEVATQQSTDDVEISFEASGEKDVSEYATGAVRFRSTQFSSEGVVIPAGTTLTSSSGKKYETTEGGTMVRSGSAATATVEIKASERGTDSNGATGSMEGAPEGISAQVTDATSGGTDKKVPIVTASDVQTAKEKLVRQSTDDPEKALAGKFPSSATIIKESFNADYGDIASSPAIGEETANNKRATLKGTVKYSLSAIQEDQVTAYLEQSLKQQMQDQTKQKIYATGVKKLELSEYTRSDGSQSVRIKATGKIGPEINEGDIKEQVAGKRYGDIRDKLTQIDGVNDVEVKFSFFWVRTVPENPDKIKIEFDIQNADE